MTASFIDIEASGLHFDSYPIEIAICTDQQLHSWLIKPQPQWTYWCETAQNIHGISQAQLMNEGQAAQVVAKALQQLADQGHHTLVSDAPAFDEDWLKTLFASVQQPYPFYMLDLMDLLSDKQQHRFNAHKAKLVASGTYRIHRAADDATINRLAFALSQSE